MAKFRNRAGRLAGPGKGILWPAPWTRGARRCAMKMRLLVALAAALMVGSDPAPDLGEVVQDQVIPPGSRWEGGGSLWNFGKGGVLRITTPDGTNVSTFRYRLDRRASQLRFDITDPGEETPSIYRIEGRRLLICFPTKAG